MTRYLLRCNAALFCFALAFTSSVGQTAIIDDFSTANSTNPLLIPAANPGPANVADTGLSGVIGPNQYRSVTLTRTSGTTDVIQANVTGGQMQFSTVNINDSANFELLYNDNDGDLNVDLTAGGTNAFGVSFAAASPVTTVSIFVDDGSTNGTATFNTGGGGAQNATLLYSHVNYTGINFSSANIVRVTITGIVDGDYFIDFFETTTVGGSAVPEPSTIVLAAVGLLSVLFFGHRRLARR